MLYIFIAICLIKMIDLGASGYRYPYQRNRVYAFESSPNTFDSSWDPYNHFSNSAGVDSNYNPGFSSVPGYDGMSGYNNPPFNVYAQSGYDSSFDNSGYQAPNTWGSSYGGTGMGGMSDMSGYDPNHGMSAMNSNSPDSGYDSTFNSGYNPPTSTLDSNYGGMSSNYNPTVGNSGFDSDSSNFFNQRYNRRVKNYDYRPKTVKTFYRRKPVIKNFDQSQPDQSNNNEPYRCDCRCNCGGCGDRGDDDQDKCFEKRCINQILSCKSNDECQKAMNKAESGVCETGTVDCGNPDIMCQTDSNECKSLWNNVAQCFNSCYNEGASAAQCVSDKCNSNGNMDACFANSACKNAFENVKNNKCDDDNNYDCGDSNFMCNGDAVCIPIWNNIVNCYNNQCSYDNNSNNNNNSNNRYRYRPRRTFFRTNEAIKQYNRVKRSKFRY